MLWPKSSPKSANFCESFELRLSTFSTLQTAPKYRPIWSWKHPKSVSGFSFFQVFGWFVRPSVIFTFSIEWAECRRGKLCKVYITNSSGADPKQHLKGITIQTLSQLHFKSIQLNSISVELKFPLSFLFNFNWIQFEFNSIEFNLIQFQVNSI